MPTLWHTVRGDMLAPIREEIEKNLKDLKLVSEEISKKHDIQIYLIQCQLAALKVWNDTLDALKGKMKDNKDFAGDNKTWYESEKNAKSELITKYMNVLKEKDKEDQGTYFRWKLIFPNN